MRVLILYGSSRGRTHTLSVVLRRELLSLLSEAKIDLVDVKERQKIGWRRYEGILMGSSTWDRGDLQRDFYQGERDLETLDLSGKWSAYFGCASILYPYYGEAISILENLGAHMKLQRLTKSFLLDDLEKDILTVVRPWCLSLVQQIKGLER